MPETKKTIGAQHEKIAGEYLIRKGYEILEYNFHCRSGEIDLIAKKDGIIVFGEVKYRKNSGSGHPLEAVTYQKQKKICQCARYYLFQNGYGLDTPSRVDVIGILGTELVHIENAFEYIG